MNLGARLNRRQRSQPTPATKLKPLRGFQLIVAILLFHLSSLLISIPETYMSTTACLMMLVISTIYLSISCVAIMTLREGDVIRINPTFALSLLGMPLFIIVGILCYVSPNSDPSYPGVKAITLLCFMLAIAFLVEAVTVIHEFRRRD